MSQNMIELQRENCNKCDFELLTKLGEGRFGSIHLAKYKEDGMIVAIKRYKKRSIVYEKMEQELFFELYHHSQLKHPNIIKMLNYFNDEDMVYLVLQYAERGTLFGEMRKQENNRFSEFLSSKYCYQIADGLNYCHDHNFFHGDLKPENVLLDAHGNAKITDFGLSWPLDNTALLNRGSYKGTLEYMAPELLKKEEYDEKIDHWSLGIMVYEFLVGRTAFYSKRRNLVIQKILNFNLKFPVGMSQSPEDLIKKLLRLRPADRISLKDTMKHPWISSNYGKA